mmetsp:Transcript_20140/g.9333  ORF Transcript_20140/g.9333 Transcript_20140/m.9333 type:complete len:85 (-) Transcript_20140:620-874(-)
MNIFHFFGLLWINCFIGAFTEFIMAVAIAVWYFSHDEEGTGEPNRPIWKGVKWGICYHAGTLAFGSLILAIVQFIKYMLHYLEK